MRKFAGFIIACLVILSSHAYAVDNKSEFETYYKAQKLLILKAYAKKDAPGCNDKVETFRFRTASPSIDKMLAKEL